MIMTMQVLTVSSKGQIALPVSMRESLSIDAGTKLAAFQDGDVIMLKTIKMPTIDDFKEYMDAASKWAESVGYTENDINSIIKDVRRNKR